MRNTDLQQECGITFARFYVCRHGLRLPPRQARRYVEDMVRIDHPHVDVALFHRADVLTMPDDQPIMVKLQSAPLEPDSPASVFADSVSMGGKLIRYCLKLFLTHGYFPDYVCPPHDDCVVTFAARAGVQYRGENGTRGQKWACCRLFGMCRSRVDEFLAMRNMRAAAK